MIKIKDDDGQLIGLAAFRYALGRMSYIVPVVCEFLIENKNTFTSHQRDTIKKEIYEAIKTDKAGDDMDIKQWKRVAEEMNDGNEV